VYSHAQGKDIEHTLDEIAMQIELGYRAIRVQSGIPGITDTPQNLQDVADVMRKNNLKQISLEPYHTLGKEKYEEHGMMYQLDHVDHYSQQQIKAVESLFHEWGFICDVV